ncbi:glycosyltransferase family 2 protein [uncultured Acinetobacter sp.]|uniref:glycosyltransferase family 2 protein n=1 Tax=uncultured Acinetobacter sp. TaxID=165433 RepID=UPI0037494874
MKIIGLMVVKNEDDIVGYCLDDAVKWADKIIIMNNGSTDKTESIILNKKFKYPDKIIYWGRYDGNFREGLRGLLYLDNKEIFEVGDWIIRLDSDEFYIDDPRDFLAKLPEQVNFVRNASFQYYYTQEDYIQERSNSEFHNQNPAERLKYHMPNWGENRCAKVTEDMKWELSGTLMKSTWPSYPVHYISSKRIRLKHFKYRSMLQMEKRIGIRFETANKTGLFKYETLTPNLEDRIKDPKQFRFDDGKSEYLYNDSKLPPLIKNDEKHKSEIVEV